MVDQQATAIIGAGWAGMSAAVTLAQRGVPVTVFEASRTLGGRARRVRVDTIDLDNGQHILIGAYRSTLALMRKVGAEPDRLLSAMPLELRFADGFRLRAPRLPSPLNLAVALFGAHGLSFTLACGAARFMHALRKTGFRVVPDRSVARFLAEHGQRGSLLTHLWEPLCVSALNTPLETASAQVFATVLRDSLTGARSNGDMLIPRVDLGRLFPDPAAQFVLAHGGRIEPGATVKRIARDAGGFRIDDDETRFARVVVAVAPQHASALLENLPELAATRACIDRLQYQPIVTCYLQYPEQVRLPAAMLGFCGGLLQWVFDRGQLGGPPGLLAAVISASGAHQEMNNEALAQQVHAEISRQIGIAAAPVWSRVIAERRATFACTPGLDRPAGVTPLAGLVLAGDYTASPYPGTLESAVRSGIHAADTLHS